MTAGEVFSCDKCQKTFLERRRLTQHRKSHSKPHHCKSCPKAFASHTDLVRHVKTIHQLGQRRYRCPDRECKYESARKDNLAQHVRSVHPGGQDLRAQNQFRVATHISPQSNQTKADAGTNASGGHGELEYGWRILMDAATAGNIMLLELALKTGLPINTEAEDGSNALHCASRAGQVSMIRYLLNMGASINALNAKRKDRTPLHEAVTGNDVPSIAALLEVGADVTLKDSDGLNALDHAVHIGNLEALSLLVDGNDGFLTMEVVRGLLLSTIKAGSEHILHWLYSKFPAMVSQNITESNCVILLAVRLGRATIVELLLTFARNMDDDPSTFRRIMSASLIAAAKHGSARILENILGFQDLNPNYMSRYGDSALSRAARNGHMTSVRLLLSHPKIDVNQNGRYMGTALHVAAEYGRLAIVKELLSAEGINTQQNDRNGYTPLDRAFFAVKLDCVKILSQYGDVETKFYDAKVPSIPNEAILDANLDFVRLMAHRFVHHCWKWQGILQEMVRTNALRCLKFLSGQEVEIPGIKDRIMGEIIKEKRCDIFENIFGERTVDINVNYREHFWMAGDWQRQNLLHVAAEQNAISTAQILLADSRINTSIKNYDERTPLDIAILHQHTEMIQLLTDHEASKSSRQALPEPPIPASVQPDAPESEINIDRFFDNYFAPDPSSPRIIELDESDMDIDDFEA